jgi:UrcA family protein
MISSFKIALTTFAITAGLIKAAPAFAEPVSGQNVSIVQLSDLNLANVGGRSVLDHRLVNAVIEVCGSASNADLVGANWVRSCRVEVLAKARADSQRLADRGGLVVIATAR